MLTIIMECRDQEPELAQTLSVLVPGAVQGLVSDVIILDHGSRDGSARVADAAGARFHLQWDMKDIVRSARGEWLLMLEPGSRPQTGWVEEIMEFIALSKTPGRLSASRRWRKPFFQRIGRRAKPLENGFLLSKRQALNLAKSGMMLEGFAAGQVAQKLHSEIIPAWVLERKTI
jgi:hypothetical protein